MTATDTRPAPRCTVSGGAGSTDADFTDMRTTADRLDAAGDDATGLCRAVLRIAGSLPEKSAVLSPGSAVKVAGTISGLTIDLESLALRLEWVARTMRWSAGVYALTDSVQRRLLAAVNVGTTPGRLGAYIGKDVAIGLVTHPPSPGQLWHRDFSGLGDGMGTALAAFQGDLMADPTLTDGVLTQVSGILGLLVPPKDLEGQIGWILATGRLFGRFDDSKPLGVTPKGERRAPHRTRRLADVVGDAADVEHRSNEDRSVLSVRHVVGADGRGGWVVTIPGTTHWSSRTDHGPSDLTANLATMSGAKSSLYPAIERALAAAMTEAGVRAGSEPVMLAGHSQGGLVAAQLAADRAFRTKYDVREVVTAGSPIDRIRMPKAVNVFSIENVHDAVPHLDAAATPNAYNRVNASCEAPPGERLDGLADAHDAARYARSAQELDRERPEIQVREWYDRNGRFLDGSSTAYEFELRRD